jgi:hypothetical protein
VSNNIDLNNPPANYRYKVSLDREETLGELCVRLIKDLGLFVFALGSVGAVYWLCYNTVTSPTAGAEEKKWAMSILSAGAAGLVGYLVRK